VSESLSDNTQRSVLRDRKTVTRGSSSTLEDEEEGEEKEEEEEVVVIILNKEIVKPEVADQSCL
jgi:hypothetical protein